MIEGKSILAIIPARGASKGVPRKNIREIMERPLIDWTIDEAKKSKYIDRLILSSEDLEIIRVAKMCGCEVPFIRPIELAQDDTPGIEPVLHAIRVMPEKYDYVILLQPTSPLRNVNDIDGCIELCINRHAKACVSVTEPEKNPYWMYTLDVNNHMYPLLHTGEKFYRRQDLPKVYVLNGAIYMAESEWLLKNRTFISEETTAYQMPSYRSIDIDSELDFKFVEVLIKQGLQE